MRPEDYREEDVRVRPARRNKRPRSKDRPEHAGARTGIVTTVDRGRLGVSVGPPDFDVEAPLWSTDLRLQPITAVRAREMGRRGVSVGDVVAVVGDVSGQDGTLARIVRRFPRTSTLTRTADDTDPNERVVVANADIMAIVTSTAEPIPRTGFIDRCLIAAYDAGIRPLLLATKTDIAHPASLNAHYRALGIEVVHAGTDDPLDGLHRIVDGHLTVLVGQSGVGKSTLVNRLVPGSDRRTGEVNEVTGRGRHTSTSAIALPLQSTGWVIDTPGVRSFGLAHVDVDRVVMAFPDLAKGLDRCPRGCQHEVGDCGLDSWVAEGQAGPGAAESLASIRGILTARAG